MKSPSPVVSFPGEALAVEPIICKILLIPFRVRLAIPHANGQPLAIFVEQEIVQSPAIFRVFYSLFPDEIFKIGLNGKFPVNWVMWKKAFSSSSPWAISRARDVE